MPGMLGLGMALGSITPTAVLATGGNANALVLRNWNEELRGAYGLPKSRIRVPSPPPVKLRPLALMVTDWGAPLTNSAMPDHSQLSPSAFSIRLFQSPLAFGRRYTP